VTPRARLLLVAAFAACGCAVPSADVSGPSNASTSDSAVLFAGPLQELVPHHDGDEYMYRVRAAGFPDSIVVQRVTVPRPGEIVVTLTKDNLALTQSYLRADAASLALVREELATNGISLTYEEPLPYVAVPLLQGTTESHSPVVLRRLATGEILAKGSAEQRLTIERAPATPPLVLFALISDRRVTFGDRTIVAHTTTWMSPGVGPMLAEVVSGGMPSRQELLCAFIEGKQIGTCPSGTTAPAE
jgi:hypothetical protein